MHWAMLTMPSILISAQSYNAIFVHHLKNLAMSLSMKHAWFISKACLRERAKSFGMLFSRHNSRTLQNPEAKSCRVCCRLRTGQYKFFVRIKSRSSYFNHQFFLIHFSQACCSCSNRYFPQNLCLFGRYFFMLM